MDRWPQRENFKSRVKEVGEALEVTHKEIAASLGISLDYFKGLLYRKTTRPDWDLAVRMSKVWNCPVTEFIDNPGQEIAGQPAADLSEKRRFLAGLMFEGITSDDLTDEDAQLLYEDHLAAKARLIAMKNRMRQGGTT